MSEWAHAFWRILLQLILTVNTLYKVTVRLGMGQMHHR